MPRAGIALGSNLGDRLSHLRAAVAALRGIATRGAPVLTSPVYRTEPLLCPPASPDFFNTVIEIAFEGGAPELLVQTRTLETALGRHHGTPRNAPRVIDIDLLYFGEMRCRDDTLELPHPRIAQRRFVLQPLADIRPDLVLPGQALTVAMLLENLDLDGWPQEVVCAGL